VRSEEAPSAQLGPGGLGTRNRGRVEVGACARRREDTEIQADTETTATCRRRLAGAAHQAGSRTRGSRTALAGERLGIRDQRRHSLDSHNVRRDFRKACRDASIGDGWVAKELRTSFVSMMSHQGVPVEGIARLAGHSSSRTTEVIYRRELRPAITTGAEVMDQIFREAKSA